MATETDKEALARLQEEMAFLNFCAGFGCSDREFNFETQNDDFDTLKQKLRAKFDSAKRNQTYKQRNLGPVEG